MKTFRFFRRTKFVWLICLAVSIGPRLSDAGDEESKRMLYPIRELGIRGWPGQLTADALPVQIHDHAVQPKDTEIAIHQAVIIENLDKMNHILAFFPDAGNPLEVTDISMVIRAGERWAAQFNDSGVFPYQCTIHPEERGSITVTP
jgi:plastocyanin